MPNNTSDNLLSGPAGLQGPDLQTLLQPWSGPCISVFLPTHREWNGAKEDAIRFRNLIREARHELESDGVDRRDIHRILRPAIALERDDAFWRTQSDGLAVFLTRDASFHYRLPLPVRESVVVNDRFSVRPLVPVVEGDGPFFILSLNLGGVRLHSATRYSLVEIRLDGVPTSLDEATRFDVYETQHQFHSGAPSRGPGNRGSVFHGHGAAADDANTKKRIDEFFRHLDNGVRRALAERNEPLVLAGVAHLRGLYRIANHHPYVTSEDIDANPDDLDATELHRRAWSIVEPHFRQARETALETHRRLVATEPELVSNGVTRVAPDAFHKRVKTLFVRRDAAVWGRFDPESADVVLTDRRGPHDQDLLDVAVSHTVRNAGSVYVLDSHEMPVPEDATATLRF